MNYRKLFKAIGIALLLFGVTAAFIAVLAYYTYIAFGLFFFSLFVMAIRSIYHEID